MYTRYAKHWLEGSGFSWNAEDGAAFGITSPLYLLFVTLVLALTQWPDGIVLTFCSALAGTMAVLALAMLIATVQRKKCQPRWLTLPMLLVVLLLMSPALLEHCASGMDTTLSFLTNSVLAVLIMSCHNPRSPYAFASILVGAIITTAARPDNVLWSALLPPLFFLLNKKWSLRLAALYVFVLSVALGLGVVINVALFNSWAPLPIWVKRPTFYEGFYAPTLPSGFEFLLTFVATSAPFLIFIILAARPDAFPKLAAIAIPMVMTFAFLISFRQIAAGNARFFYPSLAFIIMACAVVLELEEAYLNKSSGGELRIAMCVVVFLSFSGFVHWTVHKISSFYVLDKQQPIRPLTSYTQQKPTKLPVLERWEALYALAQILEKAPPSTVIAATEHGYLGSRFHHLIFVDLTGLHDKQIAHNHVNVASLLQKKPDLIIFPESPYTGLIAKLLDSELFQKEYDYYTQVYNYGLAIRKTSPWYPHLLSIVEKAFSNTYRGFNLTDFKTVPVR